MHAAIAALLSPLLLLLLLGSALACAPLPVPLSTRSCGGRPRCLALLVPGGAGACRRGLVAVFEHQFLAFAARHAHHGLHRSVAGTGRPGSPPPIWPVLCMHRYGMDFDEMDALARTDLHSCLDPQWMPVSPTCCRRLERILAKRSRLVRKESRVSWLCGPGRGEVGVIWARMAV